MRALDRTKIYDLSELNNEELQQVLDFLCKEHEEWLDASFNSFSEGLDYARLTYDYNRWTWVCQEPTANAKDLFYTLENVQVDCSDLSSFKIKHMADICIAKGYNYWNNSESKSLQLGFAHKYFQITEKREIIVDSEEENKQKITYEKFMELFGYKEKSQEFKNLVEVLNEELTEEYKENTFITQEQKNKILEFQKHVEESSKHYEETEYEVKYIAEKPKQYKIGIDTFTRCESNMTKEEILTCCKFNIDKYNWRNKGQDLEDLEKIISYANWAIKQLKK